MFSYGGVCGLRDGARRLPKVTQYLTKFAKDVAGIKEFGAVGIVKNSSLGCHRDLHNQTWELQRRISSKPIPRRRNMGTRNSGGG